MQRQKRKLRRRARCANHSAPSKKSVVSPIEPPPPPPFPPLGLGIGVGTGAGITDPGVGPEVTGKAQAALPATVGAAELARLGSTRTSAESVLFWLSVTVTRSVIDPELGAMTIADAVVAPTRAGGLEAGATTVQA